MSAAVTHLYCSLHGAEMFTTEQEVIDRELDDIGDCTTFRVEEWTAVDLIELLPTVGAVFDWAVDRVSAESDLVGLDAAWAVFSIKEVRDAWQHALDVTRRHPANCYRAQRHIRTMTYRVVDGVAVHEAAA